MYFFPGQAQPSDLRVEWEIRELRVKHQLVHLRRDPAGDEEGQSVPGHVRQGRRLKEPGTAQTSRAHTH